MRLLTQEEYDKTFSPPMVKVTHSTEEVVDLWGYADPVIEEFYHSCTAWDWRVEHIHETEDGKYQHIGIRVPKDNTYLIVIADKSNKTIIGHFILDLSSLSESVNTDGRS